MKYFIPNWEDRLDPQFDFVNDTFREGRTSPVKDDDYAHNIFSTKAYDGILMSMNIFGDKISVNGVAEIKDYEGKTIRDFLKLRNNKNKFIKTMCDCGAFSYIEQDKPPQKYTPSYISKVYENLGFDYGVSVDHLMHKENSIEENEERRKLSVKNARNFINYYHKHEFNFIPIGAVQGYDFESYRKSVISLIDMGYTHIGLGTLIPQSDEFIVGLLEHIQDLVKKSKLKVHLFGVLRREVLNEFRKLHVDSFDSASYLRKAWLRSDNNYLGSDLNWYSAIRVPIAPKKKDSMSPSEKRKITRLQKQESAILKMLNEYDGGNEKLIDEIIEQTTEYDKTLSRAFENTSKFAVRYREVLESKIWKKCNCEMCKTAGIHVVIFRRTNRNKRRGFHNTWTFYNNYLKP